jgi:hypothetical protein
LRVFFATAPLIAASMITLAMATLLPVGSNRSAWI